MYTLLPVYMHVLWRYVCSKNLFKGLHKVPSYFLYGSMKECHEVDNLFRRY